MSSLAIVPALHCISQHLLTDTRTSQPYIHCRLFHLLSHMVHLSAANALERHIIHGLVWPTACSFYSQYVSVHTKYHLTPVQLSTTLLPFTSFCTSTCSTTHSRHYSPTHLLGSFAFARLHPRTKPTHRFCTQQINPLASPPDIGLPTLRKLNWSVQHAE